MKMGFCPRCKRFRGSDCPCRAYSVKIAGISSSDPVYADSEEDAAIRCAEEVYAYLDESELSQTHLDVDVWSANYQEPERFRVRRDFVSQYTADPIRNH